MAESDVMKEFLVNLEKAVAAQSITWRQVAALSGVNEHNLSKIRHGREGVSLQRAEQIASAIGYPLYVILDPEFDPNTRKRRTKAPSAA